VIVSRPTIGRCLPRRAGVLDPALSMSPADAAQARELLARIDRATQPYFD
jgi:hypothetical protein